MKPGPSLILATLLSTAPLLAAADANVRQEVDGKQIVLDRSKGNCLACHALPGIAENDQPGNFGPALVSMKSRYPDRKQLRERIWDETRFNPQTSMPPFGKHLILTDEEIDKVVDFIHGL